jgi:TP901-1 family phage major tail protein
MASTGKNNGTLIALYKDGVKVTHSTNTSLDISEDIIDVTTKDSSGWKESIPGLRSASGSGDFLFSEDGAVNFEDFFDEINTRSSFTALWSTAVTGDKTYTGTAYITSISLSGGVEDAMTYNIAFEITGAVTKGTA